MSTHEHRWIVGLDLRPTGQGALRFVRWLGEATVSGTSSFVGIHVLEDVPLHAALHYHHLDELMTGAREQAQLMVDKAGAKEIMSETHVVRGRSADESLEAARVYHHAGGLVVGRQAPRQGHHLLRLGKVARRLLRSLQGPLMVVPPDWEPDVTSSEGPVLCATNLSKGAVEAAHFAAELAASLGRTLTLVHSVPVPDDYGAYYIPEASRQKIALEHQAEGERDLSAWAQGNGLAGAEEVVRQGHVSEQIVAVARETQAVVLVTGSRRLSAVERWLLTSVGSEIAATSPCPVAVVPPVSATV